eukprot:4264183-Pleurochrysis_carterae.AAC.2
MTAFSTGNKQIKSAWTASASGRGASCTCIRLPGGSRYAADAFSALRSSTLKLEGVNELALSAHAMAKPGRRSSLVKRRMGNEGETGEGGGVGGREAEGSKGTAGAPASTALRLAPKSSAATNPGGSSTLNAPSASKP